MTSHETNALELDPCDGCSTLSPHQGACTAGDAVPSGVNRLDPPAVIRIPSWWFQPKNIKKKKKTSKIGPTLPPILGVKIPKKYLSWPPPRYDIHPKNVDLLYLPYVVLAVQRCDSNAPMLRSPASSETGGNLEDFCHPEVPWK